MKSGKCDICGKPDSPLVPCGDHWHFACERCQPLIDHEEVTNEFTPRYCEHIARQQDAKIICKTCGKTQIEHSIEPSKTCAEYSGPEDKWSSENSHV